MKVFGFQIKRENIEVEIDPMAVLQELREKWMENRNLVKGSYGSVVVPATDEENDILTAFNTVMRAAMEVA